MITFSKEGQQHCDLHVVPSLAPFRLVRAHLAPLRGAVAPARLGQLAFSPPAEVLFKRVEKVKLLFPGLGEFGQ